MFSATSFETAAVIWRILKPAILFGAEMFLTAPSVMCSDRHCYWKLLAPVNYITLGVVMHQHIFSNIQVSHNLKRSQSKRNGRKRKRSWGSSKVWAKRATSIP